MVAGQIQVDKEYLRLLERIADAAQEVDKALHFAYLMEDTGTLNLTKLMVAVGELSEYGERTKGLPV